jgi:hypothetical protein
VRYLWGAEGGIVFLFKAHGPEAGESEGTHWSKEAFEGSAQLQDGAGTETGPASAFEEVTRINFFLSGLFSLDVGVGMFEGRNVVVMGATVKLIIARPGRCA